MLFKNEEPSQEYAQEDTGVSRDFNHALEQDLGGQTRRKQQAPCMLFLQE